MQIFRNYHFNECRKGFTLIETLFSISIIAVLTAIAVPSFSGLVSGTKVMTTARELHQSLYRARAHAISTQRTVIVCESADAKMNRCHPERSRNRNWRHGWIMYEDTDRNNTLTVADNVLSVSQNVKGIAVIFNQRGRLRFFPDGRARSAGFYLCDHKAKHFGYVRLLYTGRSRVSDDLPLKRQAQCQKQA